MIVLSCGWWFRYLMVRYSFIPVILLFGLIVAYLHAKTKIMKYIILIAVITLSVISCTKTKIETITNTDTVVKIQHDTTEIYRQALVGSWWDGSPTHRKLSFSADSMTFDGLGSDRYAASYDSIYILYQNKTYFSSYYYLLSPKNDTLTFTSLAPPYNTLVYIKQD